MTTQGRHEGWEALFWVTFEHSSNPVVLVEEQHRVLEINASALALVGRTRGSVIGRSLGDLVAPERRARAAAQWMALSRTPDRTGTGRLIRSDDSKFDVEFRARMVPVSDRRLAVYVATATPTEAAHASEALAREPLTPREREVVTHLSLGKDTAGMADELGISRETVKSHVRNAMKKFGVRNRAQLVAVWLEPGASTIRPLR